MIHEVIEKWHLHMKGQLPGGLDELLDDNVVFISPIVFTPQEGFDHCKQSILCTSKWAKCLNA